MVLILIFLYAPILTMMVLSFNKSKSRTQWGGFTLQWYTQMFDSRSIMSALTTFVISDLLGGSKILLIGNVIEQEFTRGSNWHLGSGLSLVLMVFILISMAMIAKYDKNGEGTAF